MIGFSGSKRKFTILFFNNIVIFYYVFSDYLRIYNPKITKGKSKMNYSFIKIESENALIEAISKMHKFSVIGFSNNGKISRFCRIKNQWIVY